VAWKPSYGHQDLSLRCSGWATPLRAMAELFPRTSGIVTTGGPWLAGGRTAGRTRGLPLPRRSLPVSGCQHDLELIEFIPLLVGTLSVGNCQQFLQTAARVCGFDRLLWIVHKVIISLSAGVFPGACMTG
jgi:hypothetical protein